MLEQVIALANSIQPLSKELEAAISAYFEVIEVPKRTIMLREGQRSDHLYIVLSGIVRMYYIKDGEEINCRFLEELQVAASIISFYGRKPGYEYMETVEPTIFARLHYDRLQELYTRFPEFNYIGRVITEQHFVRSEERLYLLRKHTAEERYQYLLSNNPSYFLRLPLKHIASYLGMTIETISRIRNKIRKGAN